MNSSDTLKALVCPNCGANSTNMQNCEYCGSVLIRLAYNNLPINQELYDENAFVYYGLEDELKRNIHLQRQEQKFICTDAEIERGEIMESMACQFVSSNIYAQSFKIIGIRFNIYIERGSAQEKFFKTLDIFNLFELTEQGDERYDLHGNRLQLTDIIDTYSIDYGEDYKNAARFFTIIADQVFGCGKTTKIHFNTWFDDLVIDSSSHPAIKDITTPFDTPDTDFTNEQSIILWIIVGLTLFVFLYLQLFT